MTSYAGQRYDELIREQLTEERAVKASLESRATGVTTSSGTLATLLLALSAFVSDADDFELPWIAGFLIGAAIVLFAVAIGLAVRISTPARYREAETEWLKSLPQKKFWADPEPYGAMLTARSKVGIIEVARVLNGDKAVRLRWAINFQTAAIVATGVASLVILLSN